MAPGGFRLVWSQLTMHVNACDSLALFSLTCRSLKSKVPSRVSLTKIWALLCESAGKTRTKDKYRVVYTDKQRLELEREFQSNRYITMRRKAELSMTLGLSERQVSGESPSDFLFSHEH